DYRWKNAMLYTVEFTNTNSEMVKIFLEFLRKDIGVVESRLRAQIQIHEGDDQEKLERFWSKATRISLSNFNKTIVRPTGHKVGKSSGTCKIRYSDKPTHLKIQSILDQALSEIGVTK
ncbi:MAG: hypothetical protein WD157_01325, partial [Patescibacteria group bacterium]